MVHAHKHFIGGDMVGPGNGVESESARAERGIDGRGWWRGVDDLLVGHDCDMLQRKPSCRWGERKCEDLGTVCGLGAVQNRKKLHGSGYDASLRSRLIFKLTISQLCTVYILELSSFLRRHLAAHEIDFLAVKEPMENI